MTIKKKIAQDTDISYVFRKTAENCLQNLEPWVSQLNQVILDIDMPHNDPEYQITLNYLFKMNRLGLIHFLNSLIENPTSLVEPYVTNEIINNKLYSPLMEQLLLFANKENEFSLNYWFEQIKLNFPDIELSYEIVILSIKIFYGFINSNLAKTHNVFNLNKQSKIRKINTESIIQSILFDENFFFENNNIFNYEMNKPHICIMAWNKENDLTKSNNALKKISSIYNSSNKIIIDLKGSYTCLWINSDDLKFDFRNVNIFLNSEGIYAVYSKNSQGILEFKKSYANCLKFKNFFHNKNLTENFYSFNSFNLFLNCLDKNEPVRDFISEHLGKELLKEPNLIHTLNIYIECNLNFSKTSEKIHTHRNTVIWRINKANQLMPKPIEQNLKNIVIALSLLTFL